MAYTRNEISMMKRTRSFKSESEGDDRAFPDASEGSGLPRERTSSCMSDFCRSG